MVADFLIPSVSWRFRAHSPPYLVRLWPGCRRLLAEPHGDRGVVGRGVVGRGVAWRGGHLEPGPAETLALSLESANQGGTCQAGGDMHKGPYLAYVNGIRVMPAILSGMAFTD